MSESVVRTVACVGSGTIGSAWAALFAGCGLRVKAYDPAHSAEGILRETGARAAKALGRDADELLGRIAFTTDLGEALHGAGFVQESGPESLPAKQELFAAIDRLLPEAVVIASSSSELPISRIQAKCAHPARTVIGHPINPPYAIALVEVVGGGRTSSAAIEQACAFYRSVGREPLALDREVPGFVANRLQMAMLREALQMAIQGEATIEQIDHVLMHGIGARWAAVGMFGAYALNLPRHDVKEWLAHLEEFAFGAGIVHAGPFPGWSPEDLEAIAIQWAARLERTGAGALLEQRDTLALAFGGLRSSMQ